MERDSLVLGEFMSHRNKYTARHCVPSRKRRSRVESKIKDTRLRVSFMERETRLELATSSLARKHSTTELLPHQR